MALSPPLAAIIVRSNTIVDRLRVPGLPLHPDGTPFFLIESIRESASREQLRMKSASGATALITETDFVFSVAVQGYAKRRAGLANMHPGKAIGEENIRWLVGLGDNHFGYISQSNSSTILYHSPSWEMRPGKLPAVSFILDVEFFKDQANTPVDVKDPGNGVYVPPGTTPPSEDPEYDPDPPEADEIRHYFTYFWTALDSEADVVGQGFFQFVHDAPPGLTLAAVNAAVGFPDGQKTAGAAPKWHPWNDDNPSAPADCAVSVYSALFRHTDAQWLNSGLAPQPMPSLSDEMKALPHFDQVTDQETQATYVVYRWSTTANHNVGAPEVWMGGWGDLETFRVQALGIPEPAGLEPENYNFTPIKAIWSSSAGWLFQRNAPGDVNPDGSGKWTKPVSVLSQFKLP